MVAERIRTLSTAEHVLHHLRSPYPIFFPRAADFPRLAVQRRAEAEKNGTERRFGLRTNCALRLRVFFTLVLSWKLVPVRYLMDHRDQRGKGFYISRTVVSLLKLSIYHLQF